MMRLGAGLGRWALLAALLAWTAPSPARAESRLPEGPSASATPLDFVVLSDPHVGRKRDVENLRRAVREILTLSPAPALVIVTGDLTDRGSAPQVRSYRETMERLPMPVISLPGNHDVGFHPSHRSVRRFAMAMDQAPLPSVLTLGGRHFVSFNSQWLNSRRDAPGPNDEGHAHLDALESLLSSLPPGPIFLLHHIPSVPNFVKLRATATWHAAFLERYHDMVQRFPITAVFAGHFHRDELHYLPGGVPLLLTPALSSKYGAQPAFRVVTHDERGLRLRQVYLNQRGPRRSYYRDLRGLTAAGLRSEIMELQPVELAHLVQLRYALTGAGWRLMRKVPEDRLRELLLGNYPDVRQPRQRRRR